MDLYVLSNHHPCQLFHKHHPQLFLSIVRWCMYVCMYNTQLINISEYLSKYKLQFEEHDHITIVTLLKSLFFS